MQKYEYKTVRVDYAANPAGAASTLDELGQQGWELVGVLPESSKAAILFFKKPLAG